MSSLNPRFRLLMAGAALAAILPLTACNRSAPAESGYAYGMPDLPATLPLALGELSAPVYAPAVAQLPPAPRIRTVRVARHDEHYAYAENAWGYVDALGDAPPDYGFDYDDVEPWAWQGYDDSLVFVEPLDEGYRYYFYRAGYDEPYFIRDPDCGYGFDDGRLAAVYGPYGEIIPYSDYGPRLDYASRYYVRGVDLYRASNRRHPVIVSNWVDRHDSLIWAREDWANERARQRDWLGYHDRVAERQNHYWQGEVARRRADSVRFAAWQDQDFQGDPPPRAIPAGWRRAAWARDERRYAPPVRGFDGDADMRTRAEVAERQRVVEMRQARPDARFVSRRTVDGTARRGDSFSRSDVRPSQAWRELRRAERADRRGSPDQAAFVPQDRAFAAGQAGRNRQQAEMRADRAQARTQEARMSDASRFDRSARGARIEQRRQARPETGSGFRPQRNEAARPAMRDVQAQLAEPRRQQRRAAVEQRRQAEAESGARFRPMRRQEPRPARREAQAQVVEQLRQQRHAVVERRHQARAESGPHRTMRSDARPAERDAQAQTFAEQRRQQRQVIVQQRQAERSPRQNLRSFQAEAPRPAPQQAQEQMEQRQQARQAAMQQRQQERQQGRQAAVERRQQRTAEAQAAPAPADAGQDSAPARERRERRQR